MLDLSGLPLRRERDKDEFSEVTNENEYTPMSALEGAYTMSSVPIPSHVHV